MYNKNGINLLNFSKSASTTDIKTPNNCDLTFTDGTTNQGGQVYLFHTSGTLTQSFVAIDLAKLTPTGKGSSYVSTNNVNAIYDHYGYFYVGYRATTFDENTFQAVTQISALQKSITATSGIPTITVYNTSSSDIVINEIDYLIGAGISSGDTSAKPLLLAGFQFPDVTIAPGETYTFTIMHKNS